MAMSSLLAKAGLVNPCFFEVTFKKTDGTLADIIQVKAKGSDRPDNVAAFASGENVQGEIKVSPFPGKRFEHLGIKVQLVGRIQMSGDKSDFVTMTRDLAPPSDLRGPELLPFDFKNPDSRFESYRGRNVELHYFLRVTVTQKMGKFEQKFPFWVRTYNPLSDMPPVDAGAPPLRLEVGIEDCLHLEFEHTKEWYHLQDVVLGRINFHLVRIKVKHMELEIRRRETTGAGPTAHNDSDTIARFEIMEGAPVRGTSVPIRLFLSPYALTPTYKSVQNKFSVRYFLNLVLVDEEDRRYFKQQEITLVRRRENDSPLGDSGVPLAFYSGGATQEEMMARPMARPPAPMPPPPSPSSTPRASEPLRPDAQPSPLTQPPKIQPYSPAPAVVVPDASNGLQGGSSATGTAAAAPPAPATPPPAYAPRSLFESDAGLLSSDLHSINLGDPLSPGGTGGGQGGPGGAFGGGATAAGGRPASLPGPLEEGGGGSTGGLGSGGPL